MSPEQARGAEVDHRADLWALGVVLYEMLTGRRPFHGEDDAALLRAIREHDPEPIRRVRPDVPRALARLVEHCLAKDPAARPAGAAALAAELAAFAAAEGAAAVGRRRRRGRAGLAAAVAVAAGAVWLGPWRGAGTAPPDESTLIVVPFAPVVPDTALARLGRELVITLAT